MLNIVYRFSKLEVTWKQYWLVMLGFVMVYLVVGMMQIQQPECFGHMRCFDYDRRERDLYVWNYSDLWEKFAIRHSFTFMVLEVSSDLFGNNKILPMASSAGFIVLVGMLGSRVSGTRLFGLVPAFLMLVDPLFLRYSTSVAYPNFWASLFMVAAILMFSRPIVSFGTWFLSCLFKILNFAFLPVLVILSEADRKWKIISFGVMIGILVAGVYAYEKIEPGSGQFRQFRIGDFAYGLSMWSYDMRDDKVGLAMIFVSLFFMMILNRYKVLNSRKMLLCILYFLVSPAIISAFTSFTIEPYRFLVMIGFVYVGFGLGLRNIILIAEDLKRFGKKN